MGETRYALPRSLLLKVFLCSPDHSGFTSRRHLGFLSLPHPSLLDQRLNPLWIRPRNAYANTERERQCLHYLAHFSFSLFHISPFMQPISDSMHMEISAVRKPAVLCQDPPPSLMRLHPSWPALPIPLPSGDKSLDRLCRRCPVAWCRGKRALSRLIIGRRHV